MSKEELIQFLKDNLEIFINVERRESRCSCWDVIAVEIRLCDETITKSDTPVPDPPDPDRR